MRTSLIIFAIAALCFGQDAFAQAAPKEVIVVDGQIAVNNLPASQTVEGTVSVDSLPPVFLQGATNPIPVVDVTAPIGEEYFGSFSDQASLETSRRIIIPVPAGKSFDIKSASVIVSGMDVNAKFRCHLEVDDGTNLIRLFFDDLAIFASIDRKGLYGTEQWDAAPLTSTKSVFCAIVREDFSLPSQNMQMTISWFGYLYDAPTP